MTINCSLQSTTVCGTLLCAMAAVFRPQIYSQFTLRDIRERHLRDLIRSCIKCKDYYYDDESSSLKRVRTFKCSFTFRLMVAMYVNCSGPGFGLHSDIVMPYITHYGSKEQIEHYIPQMVAGKCIGAIAMTEPGAGSDLQEVKTYAKKDGSDWILNGSKVFISNGWLTHGISLFLVNNGTKGFIKGRKLEKIGLKAQDTAELFFEDVRLPATALLGQVNKVFYYLMNELPQEWLIIAAMALASCEFMFEETRSYVKQRKAFGKTIADLQTVQHKLAEIKTQSCVGRAFWYVLLDISVQLHGGWGYMWEYPIAKAFVDSRVQPIYGGANEIMKESIGKRIVRDQ
uniref:Acyl-CoA dehydrogenase long chain n=1 Tax=Callorhinchus milii TaxID=7868 RepID=A0A4W3J4X8_CALMI